MTIKTIITEPNEILRQVSKPVQSVGNEERKLMDDMLETMYAANGIGLAAIQIDVAERIIVMDLKGKITPDDEAELAEDKAVEHNTNAFQYPMQMVDVLVIKPLRY